MTSKSPTITFRIVACTFSDNLSQNSSIRWTCHRGGSDTGGGGQDIHYVVSRTPDSYPVAFQYSRSDEWKGLSENACIKGKSNSPNLVPILERGPVCLIPKRLCARQIFLPYIALQEKATDHWEQVWPCPVASKLAGFLCPAGVLFWLAAPPPKQHSHANPACYPGYLTR